MTPKETKTALIQYYSELNPAIECARTLLLHHGVGEREYAELIYDPKSPLRRIPDPFLLNVQNALRDLEREIKDASNSCRGR